MSFLLKPSDDPMTWRLFWKDQMYFPERKPLSSHPARVWFYNTERTHACYDLEFSADGTRVIDINPYRPRPTKKDPLNWSSTQHFNPNIEVRTS